MLASVLLSWGFMLSFAKQADADASGTQAATAYEARLTIANYAPRSYVDPDIPEAPAVKSRVKLRKSAIPKEKPDTATATSTLK